MLDIRPLTIIADYFVICSGTSERQLQAISREIEDTVRREGARKPLQSEGRPDSGWLLLDYGDVIVHIFAPAERRYYELEELWSEAVPVVRIQ